MLLFEILGRRRNFDTELAESQEWFPMWIWKKFEAEETEELMVACGIEDEKESAERMVKVAQSCVQYKQESRPIMSVVVKILEGSVEIPKPLNPFPHLVYEILPLPASPGNNYTSTVPGSSGMVTESSLEPSSLSATKFEIQSASTKILSMTPKINQNKAFITVPISFVNDNKAFIFFCKTTK
ncbi:hypothetical protein VNO80_20193 [Phaseolus coccineus]|uniref:Serine-threonine/tyrosine-protein kinase catalytic domain-containing protein n=1 Tax=Phaseolus coccineus TaxID=3886 RepID=A0AAN9QY06_PHACN